MTKRYPNIPAEIDAELSPKARKFFHDLIDDYERHFAELNKRIAGLEEKLQKLTPKNSSIPLSTQHPHAKEKPNPKKRKAKTRKKQGRTTRTSANASATGAQQRLRRSQDAAPASVSQMQRAVERQGSGTTTSSSDRAA